MIPTTATSLEQCREVVRRLRRCCSEMFPLCEIKRVGIDGCDSVVDALYYPIVGGTPLVDRVAESLDDQEVVALYAAVELMDGELRRCRLVLDIAPQHLIVGADGRLYPTSLETAIEGVSDCAPLRAWLTDRCGEMPAEYSPVELERYDLLREYRVGEYMVAGYPHEGRIKVCHDDGLYGFVDETGEVIVAPQYLSADDFRESRAVVETRNGYGVINLWGEEVIPTQYQDLSYNEDTGISCAKRNDMWQYISYSGEPLTEPSSDYPEEDFRGE